MPTRKVGGSLEKYRRKRNLRVSPEPAGNERLRSTRAKREGKTTRRTFVVQKHLASHLHYDFRLEHNGVLLSWAVPKGPSLNPADKRLAMHVEDHPLEYGRFEGVIPSGYGAGIVMLWDYGTWEPEEGYEDVDAALKKGQLKFRLDGTKLKGGYVLVRTRWAGGRGDDSSSGEGRGWLLIKHRDEFASEENILETQPLSVESGGDLADILAKKDPNIWESHRPAESGDAGALFKRIIRQALEIKAKNAGKGPRGREVGKRSRTADGRPSREAKVATRRRPASRRARERA